jgi:hypothetical protein
MIILTQGCVVLRVREEKLTKLRKLRKKQLNKGNLTSTNTTKHGMRSTNGILSVTTRNPEFKAGRLRTGAGQHKMPARFKGGRELDKSLEV